MRDATMERVSGAGVSVARTWSEWNGTKMRTSESVRAQSMGVAGAEKFVWPCMLESGGDIQKKVNGTKGL